MRATRTPRQSSSLYKLLSVFLTVTLVSSLCPTYTAGALETPGATETSSTYDMRTDEQSSEAGRASMDEGNASVGVGEESGTASFVDGATSVDDSNATGGQDDEKGVSSEQQYADKAGESGESGSGSGESGSGDAKGDAENNAQTENDSEQSASTEDNDSVSVDAEDDANVTGESVDDESGTDAIVDEVADAEEITEEAAEAEATIESVSDEKVAVEKAESKKDDEASADSEEGVQIQSEDQTLEYEANGLKVTVTAANGVLPDGATLEVEEIHPVTEEKADAYGEALSSLSETLRKEDKVYSAAKVYDIRILDAKGKEIEPNDEVTVSIDYQKAQPMGEAKDPVDVAHLTDDGELQMMDADVDTTKSGAVKSTEFTTDSFSYYILFGTSQGSESEPFNVGTYGWIKFATPKNDPVTNERRWGSYQGEQSLPATNTEEGYRRILKVNLHTLKPGMDAAVYNDTNYTSIGTDAYFWTWENSIYVNDFYVPGYEVVETKMHTAWTGEEDDVWRNSLVGVYDVRGYRSSDGASSDLNVLDIYMKSMPVVENAMRYIIRYVHADGAVTDGNVRYLSSGSTLINLMEYCRGDEKYGGTSFSAGVEAIGEFNEDAKTVRIDYTNKVQLAKINVYYESTKPKNANTDPNNRGRYDKDNNGYYTAEKGLYTNKYATTVNGEGKEREFLVNLESWYVDGAASVGMVLDASGSMAWTAGVPPVMELTQSQYNELRNYSSASNPIPLNKLSLVMDPNATDSTSMGYNDYVYYVYTPTTNASNAINEYVALGYTDGNMDGGNANQNGCKITYLGKHGNSETGKAEIKGYYTNNNSNAGWYYVNSGTNTTDYAAFGGKRFEGLGAVSNGSQAVGDGKSDYPHSTNESGPAKFYVKNVDGKYLLYCHFSNGNAVSSNGVTGFNDEPVRIKRDQMFTKAETLQDAISQFGAILNAESPASEVAMTRFSHQNFNDLLLMDWSKDSEDIVAALNLTDGATGAKDAETGLNLYGLTGGTVAYKGVNAFKNEYDGDAENEHKYLIIFTDGKDQGKDRKYNNVTCELTKTGGTNNLDDMLPGYTIITVFMKSTGMTPEDIAYSKELLESWASGGKDGDPGKKLYFEADSDNVHEMVDQFREIAKHIASGLHGYSVRDYIDPRFDVINEAGQVLSVLDSEGQFRKLTNPDVDEKGFRSFTTPDGKQAMLGYDFDRKMFYVLWQGQNIPVSAIGAGNVAPESANLWSGQIRIQAKEDFIGGNDVLTNGNEADENLVYMPSSSNPLVPTTEQKRDNNGELIYDHGRPVYYDKATFPYASVNPGLLDVKLSNYEDTIFLGEEVTPGELLSTMMEKNMGKASDRSDANHRVADTVYNAEAMKALGDEDLSSKWYVEYLERLGKKLHNDVNYYYKLLREVNSAADAGTITTQDGETFTVVKTGNAASIKLELPYYYLESPTDSATYAGPSTSGTDPQEDKVGTLTYEWKLVDFARNTPSEDENDEANSFVEFDTYVDESNHMDTTNALKYQFSMSYEPLAPTEDAMNGDNGSERTRALTGLGNDALIRDTVGRPWKATADQSATGLAAIHAVDGRILVEKRMLATDLQKMKAKYPNAQFTLKLTGAQNVEVWSKTLDVSSATAGQPDGDYVYIISEWATDLPQGDYTLTEILTDEFGKPVITGIDSVEFNGDSDPAKPYDNTPANWKARYENGENSVTWHIGKMNPGQLSYTVTDYSNNVVNDNQKNVDPLLATNGAKNYLNAQLGRAQVTNVPVNTSIEVIKTWNGVEPEGSIVVRLVGSDGSVRYQKLEPSTWKATFEGLDVDGTRYTAVEGTGTVEDGECANFSPFSTTGRFTFDNKTYKQVSVTYTDIAPEGGTSATDAVVANVKNKAGSIAFTNECVTKVTVQKHWAGITPGQPTAPAKPLVIKLHSQAGDDSSTGNDRFVELNPSNNWMYTFEDIPAVANLRYAIVEGTGTVSNDGSCDDFMALPKPDAEVNTFTFDGKKYRQKEASLTYTTANGTNAGAYLDGSVSPDAGKAEVTNEALTTLVVRKDWEPGASGGNESIYVQLYKGAEPEGNPVELKGDSWAHEYTDLLAVAGDTYTVKEGQIEDGEFIPYDGAFNLNGQRMRQKSIVYYSDLTMNTVSTALNGGASPFGGIAVITNELVKAHIKLKKVDATDNTRLLPGAVFELYKDAGALVDGQPSYDAETDNVKVVGANDATSFTTNASGELTLPDLLPGAYWLKETAAPTGYLLRDEAHPTGIVVDGDGVVTLVQDVSFAQEMRPTLSEPSTANVYTVTMPNLRTYLLPATGGPGVHPFLFVGAFIAVYALAGDEVDVRRLFGRSSRKGSRGASGPLGGD